MWIIKRIVQILVVLAIVFVVGAYLLPREVEVSRTASMSAPAEKIFPYVNSMQASSEWSPWLGLDPEMKVAFSGPEEGVGNMLEWTSEHPNVGNGSQVITASVQNERVETALDFGPMGTADAFFDLVKAGEGTDVTWGFKTDLGMNPMARWMGLMMDSWVGKDYEAGLANIKTLVEG